MPRKWIRSGRRGRVAALLAVVALTCGAGGGSVDLDALGKLARSSAKSAIDRLEDAPPADRVTWGGLAAATLLGSFVVLERMARLKRKTIIPPEFTNRFLSRLREGKLDRGKALDYCELNPSPASRVALSAVRRWGRSSADLDRASAIAQRVEADRLRRNVGTLRRVAALTPLIGLLGTLLATGQVLKSTSPDWGPGLASALSPLTAGVALAVLFLVAYDGLASRVDSLIAALDRIGAETVDAVAMALPVDPRPPLAPARTPHAPTIRIETSESPKRQRVEPDDYD